MNIKSNFLQEFIARGYFSNCTNLDDLDNLMLSNKISAYIGFDCTAKSLHVGSLMQIMILRLLIKYKHIPIILLGGGTTKIGDPSGKDESRQMLNETIINHNFHGIKNNLEKFINFNDDAIILNNDSWLKNLNYIDFLRDIGKHFSINRMLSFDSVKLRLEREQNLSFIEFNYMILQAYDFYYLNKNHNCILQIGGSDQWGNIVNGVELIRKINAQTTSLEDSSKISFGLTTPLLTTADGKKMGKTAEGAIWLDESLLSPYEYFQYFRNSHDDDVIKFLKLFTDLDLNEIKKFENLSGKDLNIAKEILAFETTKICHGEEIAKQSLEKAKQIFIQKNTDSYQEKIVKLDDCKTIKITDLMVEIKFCESKSIAKRLIEGKGVKINDNVIDNINFEVSTDKSIHLSIGKKNFFKIIFD